MKSALPVIDADALQEGQGQSVRLENRALAVFKHEGNFYVMDDECPHVGAPLGNGWLENGQVICSFHGWAFDLKTGACSNCPGRPVKTYPTRVENGKVHIEIENL